MAPRHGHECMHVCLYTQHSSCAVWCYRKGMQVQHEWGPHQRTPAVAISYMHECMHLGWKACSCGACHSMVGPKALLHTGL